MEDLGDYTDMPVVGITFQSLTSPHLAVATAINALNSWTVENRGSISKAGRGWLN